jgi:LPS-assembly lipoprotein
MMMMVRPADTLCRWRRPVARLPWRVALVLMILVAGCGYQLRGSSGLPAFLERAFVDNRSGDDQLGRSVRAALRDRGAEVVDAPEAATGILRVHGANLQRRVLSVASTGKAAEYELTYRIQFSALKAGEAAPQVPRQTVTVRADVRYDVDAVLSADAEERRALREMRAEAGASVMQRIDFQSR